MKRMFLALLCVGVLSGANCFAQKDVLARAEQLELKGDFKGAGSVLSQALDIKTLPAADRKQVEFELDRLARIKLDFPYTKDALFADLKKSVKGLTTAEYEQWVREGQFDSREIDGKRYFMSSSVSNLFFRYPELYARRLPPGKSADLEKRHWETCVAIQKAAMAEKRPYVLPKRFKATMTVTADADVATAGETLRAWLPIPREYPFQTSFQVLSSSPAIKRLDDSLSPIRSAYFEQPAIKGRPTEFKLAYEYATHGVWFDLKPEEVRPCDTNDPALLKFTREAPHIVFTPEIRALSQQIAGDETNACLKAKKFYDWIADSIKYSYAIEYSTIRNISDYCRTRAYGDCGQEALLFMTLCRLNGIPARWQSGWNTFPGAESIHDWTEIYLAPYGWVPVDPYMGIFATRYATTLTPEQRRQIRDFYFGGLDQYRMIANSDHNQILNPPKQTMRSDNVDFQRGELESGSHNIYFNEYSYKLHLKELKVPGDKLE
jgi:transglutaminase-like putative cysteine protease